MCICAVLLYRPMHLVLLCVLSKCWEKGMNSSYFFSWAHFSLVYFCAITLPRDGFIDQCSNLDALSHSAFLHFNHLNSFDLWASYKQKKSVAGTQNTTRFQMKLLFVRTGHCPLHGSKFVIHGFPHTYSDISVSTIYMYYMPLPWSLYMIYK